MILNEVPKRWTRLAAAACSTADQGLASNCVFREYLWSAYIRRRPMVIISLLASDCSLPRLETYWVWAPLSSNKRQWRPSATPSIFVCKFRWSQTKTLGYSFDDCVLNFVGKFASKWTPLVMDLLGDFFGPQNRQWLQQSAHSFSVFHPYPYPIHERDNISS